MDDFMQALELVKPAFGISSNVLENSIRGGYFMHSEMMRELHHYCSDLIKSLRNSEKT